MKKRENLVVAWLLFGLTAGIVTSVTTDWPEEHKAVNVAATLVAHTVAGPIAWAFVVYKEKP